MTFTYFRRERHECLAYFAISQLSVDVLGTVLILELNETNFSEKFREERPRFSIRRNKKKYYTIIRFGHFYLKSLI